MPSDHYRINNNEIKNSSSASDFTPFMLVDKVVQYAVEIRLLQIGQSKNDYKILDFVREQGTKRLKSGAYTKYVSIFNRFVTPLTDKR